MFNVIPLSKIHDLMEENQIFKDLKIVELASVLAGPSVGQFFAELGAHVLKIENPNTNGDVTRSWKLSSEDPESKVSSYFASANWGKQHIFIDIKNNVEEVYSHIKDADILISSYKPGDAQKLKVDYNTLQKINPNIIYGNISGYGENDGRVGYDAVLQAEAGFMYMNGEPTTPPTKMPVAIIDIVAAHQMKEAILTALYIKLKTGKGSLLNVSLFDSAISTLANQGTNYLNADYIPKRAGSEHPNIVPYGRVFTTNDNKEIVLAVGNDKQFKALCEILEIKDIGENANYSVNAQRVKNRKKLYEILEKALKNFDSSYLMKAFIKHKIPGGAVNSMKDLFELKMAQNMILEYSNNNLKGIKNVAFNMK